jgi:hypothetical protein
MNNNCDCIHSDAFRRLPKSQGGLGLCPGRIDQPEPDTDARMEKLIFNKEKFLGTDFGKALKECVTDFDAALTACSKHYVGSDEYHLEQKNADVLLGQWWVYQLAMQQFYGLWLYFTRTDKYFGVCTGDEAFWLFRIERVIS